MKIVALHGNIGSFHDYDFLRTDFDLEAVNLWDYSHLSLEEIGEKICEIAGEFSEPVCLLGYSMGGRIALHAMAVQPDLWSRAIIVSAHPGLNSETEKADRIEIDQNWAHEIRNSSWDEFLHKWNSQSVLKNSEIPSSQLALESARNQIADAFINWSLGKQTDMRSTIESFPGELTWVVGELDQKFLGLAKTLPVQSTVVEKTGHRILIDNPDAIRSILES